MQPLNENSIVKTAATDKIDEAIRQPEYMSICRPSILLLGMYSRGWKANSGFLNLMTFTNVLSEEKIIDYWKDFMDPGYSIESIAK